MSFIRKIQMRLLAALALTALISGGCDWLPSNVAKKKAEDEALAKYDPKEIKGAFGLKLGEKFEGDPSKKVSNGIVPSEYSIYEMSPPEPTDKFKLYYAIVSPEGKLLGIIAKMPYTAHVSSMRIYEDLKQKLDETYGAVQQKPIPPIYLGSEYLYKGKRIQLKIRTNVAYGKEVIAIYTYAPGTPEHPPKVLP